MAVSVRRKSQRPKRGGRQASGAVESARGGVPSWGNEALAVVLFAAALLIFGSVLSRALMPLDPDLPISHPDQPSNILGPVGRFVGAILFGALGWCSLLLVGWLGWLSSCLWRHEIEDSVLRLDSKVVRGLGLVGSLLGAAGVAATYAGSVGGGSLGSAVALPAYRLLNTFGATVVLSAVAVLCVAMAFQVSVGSVLAKIARGLLAALGFMLIGIPTLLTRSVLVVVEMLLEGSYLLVQSLFGDRLAYTLFRRGSPPPPLPKPRVRKNREQAEEFSDDDETEQEGEEQPTEDDDESSGDQSVNEAEDATHVVVNRRTSGIEPQKKKATKRVVGAERHTEEYHSPDLALLTKGEGGAGSEDDAELLQKSRQIESKLKDFGINGKVTQVHPGPVITLFEFEPAAGVKVGRIVSYQDDLAMSLRTTSVRIIAPIPKRGTVGIEVPNRLRDMVRLRDVLESDIFSQSESVLTVALGKDTYGEPVCLDIASMPHLLMAGATGTGKSVCINALLLSLLYRSKPSEVGLILIDPKILELSIYDGIPHLRVPVVTVPRQARAVLEWAAKEMDRRYRMMQKYGVRNIDGYNKVVAGQAAEARPVARDTIELKAEQVVALGDAPEVNADTDETGDVQAGPVQEEIQSLDKIVIVIDELADLMLTSGREIEEVITRLAQKARAAGIHLIVATQRPSVDVITGLIKANFPARLSFQVSSRIDSRTILDSMGAEKLLGKGDMLVIDPTVGQLRRIHGAFVSDAEVKRVVDAVKETSSPSYDESIMRMMERALEEDKNQGGNGEPGEGGGGERDPFYDQCVALVLEKRYASTSMLQRAFRLGYNRAARIIETLEREGIVGPMDGAKPRQVLVPDRTDGE